MKKKILVLLVLVALVASIAIASPVSSAGSGTIVIILEIGGGGGWTNIHYVMGIDEADIDSVRMGTDTFAHDDIGKIGGIDTY